MGYDPRSYWSERLAGDFSLRGVGYVEYSEVYNRWLYRQKRAVLDRALRDSLHGAQALDVGSGVGWGVRYLLGRRLAVTGCDIAENAVERLIEQYPAAEFFRLTVGSDPIPREAESFDVVSMIDVAYHIVDDGLWRAAVNEMGRVLRPSGQIVVTDALGRESFRQADHVRKRSLADWEAAARAARLRVARVGPLFRWLSRPRDIRVWRHVPDATRGALEFALERLVPVEPHMRWAVLVKG